MLQGETWFSGVVDGLDAQGGMKPQSLFAGLSAACKTVTGGGGGGGGGVQKESSLLFTRRSICSEYLYS